MANRGYQQFSYGLEKMPVTIRMCADGGGAGVNLSLMNGATTPAAASGAFKGVKSITRVGDGTYTVTFQDTYQRLLGVRMAVYSKDESTAPTVAQCYVKAQALQTAGGGTMTLVIYLATIGTPVAPATNDRLYFEFSFSNSTAP